MPTGTNQAIPRPGHRTRDARAYEAARLDHCELCGQPASSGRAIQPHHTKTRGAGGGDTPDNLISLCSTLARTGCHDLHHAGRIPRAAIDRALALRTYLVQLAEGANPLPPE